MTDHDDQSKSRTEIESPELDGVSGGGALDRARRKAKKAAETFPDVSVTPTPGGPIPVPYPNVPTEE